jgi:hypothetical protein
LRGRTAPNSLWRRFRRCFLMATLVLPGFSRPPYRDHIRTSGSIRDGDKRSPLRRRLRRERDCPRSSRDRRRRRSSGTMESAPTPIPHRDPGRPALSRIAFVLAPRQVASMTWVATGEDFRSSLRTNSNSIPGRQSAVSIPPRNRSPILRPAPGIAGVRPRTSGCGTAANGCRGANVTNITWSLRPRLRQNYWEWLRLLFSKRLRKSRNARTNNNPALPTASRESTGVSRFPRQQLSPG